MTEIKIIIIIGIYFAKVFVQRLGTVTQNKNFAFIINFTIVIYDAIFFVSVM